MSAAGRLWRRAPVWRLALLSAIAMTGLAVMFPPPVTPLRWPLPGAHRAWPGGAIYRPRTEAAPVGAGALIETLPDGSMRTGLMPFAGRILPLPAGHWQDIAIVSSPGDQQQVYLARVVEHHLTGLVIAAATGVFGGSAGPIGVPPLCGDEDRIGGEIVPVLPGQNPLQHECWALVPTNMKSITPDTDLALSRVLARLGERGVAVPDRMLAAQFVRSTDRGWQATMVMVPDEGGPTTALTAWARRYQALLHKGFDNTATAADLTQPAVSIP